MRIPGRVIFTASTLALAAGLLTGCTHAQADADPTRPPKPSPTPTPVFTSDADALAAATKVYKEFEAASDQIGRDGWADPSPIRPFVSEAGYQHEVQTANNYHAQHAHGVGETVINNAVLQSARERAGRASVTMYVCEDLRKVDIVDASGKSLISDRADFVSYVVELEGPSRHSLKIQSIDYWSGGGICRH